MNVPLYQHVLFKDLQSYLKRTDYLGGYTDTEKAYIRANLGLDDIEASTKAVTLDYSLLLSLMQNDGLHPGSVYIIQDFRTIYQSKQISLDKYVSYGNYNHKSLSYTIIAIAATTSTLFSNVMIAEHPTWDVKYDPQLETLDDGETTMGRIVYLCDDNNNKACYDFKNYLYNTTDGLKYTFDNNGTDNSDNCSNNNIINAENIIFNKECKNNIIYGKNIVFLEKIDNFVGELNNTEVKLDFSGETIKTSIKIEDTYNIDYLDLETLTHLFYATDINSLYISL